MVQEILRIEKLKKYYPIRSGLFRRITGYVRAVDGVSLTINEGEVISIVGESGSGKTTIAKCILLLEKPTDGSIFFKNKSLTNLKGEELKEYRRNVQAVFQNPFLSLNPRMNVEGIISEPIKAHLKISKPEIKKKIYEVLELVGLSYKIISKYPHELSGGQAQRVAIARAVVLNPKLIILDEPTSALDVSVQAQILNLLADLKDSLNLSYLMISHDLSVVRYISDKIIVLYLGKIMEYGSTETIFKKPAHPYTQALLSSVPDPYYKILKERIIPKGEPPSPINPPSGCRFHTRCPYFMPICKREPPLVTLENDHKVICWLYAES